MKNRTLQLSVSTVFSMLLLVLSTHALAEKQYVEIEWPQLMPADDLAALMDPPEFLSEIQDGAENDNIESLKALSEGNEKAKRFKQALTSSRVIDAFNNQNIRIPGFVVPLQADEEQKITQFFIVPYFGACLHLPPPPPNQIIYAESKKGITVNTLQDAFWFEGTLVIDTTENELGNSAYSMLLDEVTPY